MARWILALLLAIAASPARAQGVDPDAPTISVRAEKGKVELGETFHVWVSVLHKPELKEVNIPSRLPPGGPFEELKDAVSSEKVEPDGMVRHTFDLTVAGFQTGTQAFPSIEVGYEIGGEHRTLRTDAFEIQIVSVVGDGKEELKPNAPPVAVSERDWMLAWIAAGILAAALAAALAFWFARRAWRGPAAAAGRPGPAVNLPPDEAALQKLRALATSGLLDADDRRPVYFALTEILREYLGRRYGFEAMELTTTEFITALDRNAGDLAARPDIVSWLDGCDLVKYARVPVSRDEAVRALEQAVTLVERTRPIAAPAPPVAPPPPAAVDGPAPGAGAVG